MPVPSDVQLRERLENKTLPELTAVLSGYKRLHNTTDVDTVKRAIRAIEIEEYHRVHPEAESGFPPISGLVFGLQLDRDIRRQRITQRLQFRLEEGMVSEVQKLSERVSIEDLIYYGLEYKYLSLYITGVLSYEEMFRQLEIAIHQFAKRQMTWFRGMETRGTKITWLNALADPEENVQIMLDAFSRVG